MGRKGVGSGVRLGGGQGGCERGVRVDANEEVRLL